MWCHPPNSAANVFEENKTEIQRTLQGLFLVKKWKWKTQSKKNAVCQKLSFTIFEVFQDF